MPAGKGPPRPPKHCWICQQAFEQPLDRKMYGAVWGLVNAHLKEVHPDYLAWDQSWSRRGRQVLTLFVVGVLLGVITLFLAAGLWPVTIIFYLFVFAPLGYYSILPKLGARRFRREWEQRLQRGSGTLIGST
jgi:hypothetical protein